MERHIQKMMELSLSEEELLLLERQHKQLNIIIEQLRGIQAAHYKNIVLTKRRLQLKGAAGKIVSAIQGQTTDTVTEMIWSASSMRLATATYSEIVCRFDEPLNNGMNSSTQPSTNSTQLSTSITNRKRVCSGLSKSRITTISKK